MVKRLEISLARSAGLSGWGTLGRPDWLQLSERDLIIHYSGSESIRDPSCRHGVSSQVQVTKATFEVHLKAPQDLSRAPEASSRSQCFKVPSYGSQAGHELNLIIRYLLLGLGTGLVRQLPLWRLCLCGSPVQFSRSVR